MAKSSNRVFVKLKSSESGYCYYTSKSRISTPDRMVVRKYDPVVRKHLVFKEQK